MKILVVQESDWLERGPHQQHHLLERLQEKGHEVLVIDFEIDWRGRKNYEPLSRRKVIRAPCKTIEKKSTTVVRPAMIHAPIFCYALIPVVYSLEIIRQIKSFKPDIIIGMGILNTYLAAQIAGLYGIPFLYYIIDSLHTLIPEAILRPIGRLIERSTMRKSNKILVINRTLGRYVKRIGAVNISEVITAGIEKTRFHQGIDGKPMRKVLGFKESDMILFFMGWLYEFSGLKEVASKIVAQSESDMKLLVLGRGDLFQHLKRLAETHKEEGKIHLVDWVPYEEVPQYIAAADICILPAQINEIMQDIVPIKMYEYLAIGKPVVTTRLPGVFREFGHNSGVVYAKSSKTVVDLAERVLRDSNEYERLSRAAIRCTESLDWSYITDRFESVLLEAVGGIKAEDK